jgi:hypothetical protein
MTRILTIQDTTALAEIIGWCQRTDRLMWLDDRGDVAYGTARSIGDANGNFLAAGEDVRDAYVRITTAMGFEWFVLVAEVMVRQQEGTMVRERVGS